VWWSGAFGDRNNVGIEKHLGTSIMRSGFSLGIFAQPNIEEVNTKCTKARHRRLR
jgi:hypothetical protein